MHTQFWQADGGDPDSTPQPHHKRPGQGRQSSRTLPEVPIVRQFQKFLFWICLFFTWGEAIAVSCDGSVETQQAHQAHHTGSIEQSGSLLHRHSTEGCSQASRPDVSGPCYGQIKHTGGGDCWACFLIPLVPQEHDLDFSSQYRRQGEAMNPGPFPLEAIPVVPNTFLLTQSNGGSLRDKTQLVASLGPGIHSFSETHLTGSNFPSFRRTLKHLALQQHRKITSIPGFHAPARDFQQQVGSWTGVLQVTDYRAHALALPWPEEHWHTGRLQVARHNVGGTPLVVASVYGYPTGPTWGPQAHTLTNSLLGTLTKQIVYGATGPRLICGDFNCNGILEQQRLWQAQGWHCAQDYAVKFLGHEWTPTNGAKSAVDQIWISPEAAMLLQRVSICQVFRGHATLALHFSAEQTATQILCWPRPSLLPWETLKSSYDQLQDRLPELPSGDATMAYKAWAKSIEDNFESAAKSEDLQLPPQARGRGQRTSPSQRTVLVTTCRRPREGELELKYDLVSTAVRHWYVQGRRMQSLLHALRSASRSLNSEVHKIELWSAIVRSKGFEATFSDWWNNREPKLPDTQFCLPVGCPELAKMDLIFQEFQIHFRLFEAWHAKQRIERYEMLHEKSTRQLHKELKGQKSDCVQHFHFDEAFEVVDTDQDRIRLDKPANVSTHSCWLHESELIHLTNFEHGLFKTSKPLALGDTIILRNFVSDTEGICSRLTEHWSQRWCQISAQSPEQIGKVLDFARAFLPRLDFQLAPLTIQDWRQALKRMKIAAARGADGISRLDLLSLSDRHLDWLVQLFNAIEAEDMPWPRQMLTGLVTCISKVDDPHLPDHFRPIHLFTVAHRIWASIRVRQLLRLLLPFVPDELHGFMPTKETTQVWFEIQCWIELALAQGVDWHGCSADIQKCFNSIERPAYLVLAEQLGTPNCIRVPWQAFLASFERRFQVMHTVSSPIHSIRGFPEGCPLSILTMIHIGWGYHTFMRFFHPRVQCLSFVDNLDFHGGTAEEICQAVDGTQDWFEDYGLRLDLSKTFYWSTRAAVRQQWQRQGFKVFTDTKELGGAMTLCRSVRNRALKARSEGLETKWKQLSKSLAPVFHKLQVLATVFWPLALHGASARLLAEGHLNALRRAATKATGLNCAGANSWLRFLLLDKTVQDPSFYHHKTAVMTFRRMLQKVPDLLQLWRLHFGHLQSPFFPGPYTKLIHFFGLIGWTVVDPPWIADHHGCLHDLLTQDKLGPVCRDTCQACPDE